MALAATKPWHSRAAISDWAWRGVDIYGLLCYIYIVHMNEISFAWDNGKALLNKKKHGVSFEEARSVFYDEYALEFYDPDNSQDEDRFLMLGVSESLRVLVVCHCVREEGSVIRIISARKAVKKETEHYWRERK